MTKYRVLTKTELEELQPEFIQYLSSNGIDADKWKEILDNDQKEMDAHIVLFSDIVFQKSLENIHYIEHRSASDVKLFHFDKEEAFLIALKSSTVDLEKIDSLKETQLKEIDLFNASKKYSKTREEEIFDLLNKGCIISKGALYYQVKQLVG